MAQNTDNHSHKNGSPTKESAATQNHQSDENNAALLPQLESLERMMKFPVVEAAWHQGQDVYGKVKGMLKYILWEML